MESDASLTCTAVIEWLSAQGTIIKKANHRTAVLRLVRNNQREIFIEARSDKPSIRTQLELRNIQVFNRFMTNGKASIKFQKENCTMFLSNAPAASLVNFLKMIFVKMTGQGEKPMKNPLRETLLTNKSIGGIQEISPATTAEIKKAQEKAAAVSRSTITTPSPSGTKKRPATQNNTRNLTGKRLYENPAAGSAGTGKSFLLKKIIGALPPDVTTVTASTGVAACHIGGVTLHQFAGIGLGTAGLQKCYELASKAGSASIWRKTKHLVIDEISMVDGDFFDKIEAIARHVRKNDKPFGGIQLILCGDFFQLPPVSKRDEQVKFCFQSKAWNTCVQMNFELHIVHRQKDPEFVNILNSIRIGRVTDDIENTLKATAKQKIEKNGVLATRLCSHVNEANEINDSQLEQLSGSSMVFNAQDSDGANTKMLDQQLPVPAKLLLKIGAQVMLLKNLDISSGLVNGARGVVTSFKDGFPVVHFRSGAEYMAKVEKWTVKAGGGMIYRKQIPLKLAWAFSIHKSQGLTLDCVEMSLARVFDAGQAYVALSRAESLRSLRVLDFHAQQVWANQSVLEFFKRFRRCIHEMEIIPLGKKKKISNN
ncbi:ATP-dependent DNA helicase PIF1 isoform X2 [Orussus abietinus]|uniref:ATP-dependent DNA helicase PIF1 isoform X2 n=1 Tax=Orussus abietinus TaxID=222816 RepID=UPI0006252F9D|nr:ATP-dependent DNA helicase PIF1 isoform X2 [Orussus abietinus]